VKRVQGWPPGLPALNTQGNTPTRLKENLQKGLYKLRAFAGGAPQRSANPTAISPALAPFAVIHPDYYDVAVVTQPFADWDDAADKVGRELMLMRRQRPPDTAAIRDFVLQQVTPNQLQRAAFGLPLPFFFPRLGRLKKVTVAVSGEKHDRSASPLLLHFSRLQNGQLVPVMSTMRTSLLAPGEPLKVEYEGRTATLPVPGAAIYGQLVDEWRQRLGARRWAVEQVEYWKESGRG
jgi:hypothetical protein